MRCVHNICLLLPILVCGGCLNGPWYVVEGMAPHDGRVDLYLGKYRTWAVIAPARGPEENYLAATTPFHTPASQAEAVIRIGPARRFFDNGPDEGSRFEPIEGSPLWVQVRHSVTDASVTVHKPNGTSRGTVATFGIYPRDPAMAGFAVTPSGRFLLVVDSTGARLYDVPARKVLRRLDGSLAEVRRGLVELRHSAGEWWLTSDLRYVIIAPSRYVYEPQGGLTRSIDPMPLTVRGITADVTRQGFVFSVQTGSLSLFPLELDRDWITDAESTGRGLRLLYTKDSVDLGVVIADADGHALTSRTIAFKSRVWKLATWEPAGNRLWFLGRDATSWMPEYEPTADYLIEEWDYQMNSARDSRVRVQDIRQAIEASRWASTDS